MISGWIISASILLITGCCASIGTKKIEPFEWAVEGCVALGIGFVILKLYGAI